MRIDPLPNEGQPRLHILYDLILNTVQTPSWQRTDPYKRFVAWLARYCKCGS